MANRDKGETDLVIGDVTYRMVLDVNAMVALETLFSTPEKEVTFGDVLERVNRGRLTDVRAFFWASLQRYQPHITLEAAGDLIQAAGGLRGFTRQLEAIANGTVPDQEDLAALGVPSRPRAAQGARRSRVRGGTGAASTSTPGASV